jgi:hypothetical protein
LRTAGIDGGEVLTLNKPGAQKVVAISPFSDDVSVGNVSNRFGTRPSDEGSAGERWIGSFGDEKWAKARGGRRHCD